MPILALFLIASLGLVSFFGAPLLLDALKDNSSRFKERTADIEKERLFKLGDTNYSQLDVFVAATMWIILLATSAFAVSGAMGGSPVEKEEVVLRPRTKDPKEIMKYERKLAKIRKAKIKETKRLKAQQEREEKKKPRRPNVDE
jgi:hypothetical protein